MALAARLSFSYPPQKNADPLVRPTAPAHEPERVCATWSWPACWAASPPSSGWPSSLRKKARMPRLLELFSGTGSIGRAFEAEGWEVVSVDLDPKFRPTVCCDVMQLDEHSLGSFDMVWSSPVCTEYSRALSRRPRDLAAGDRLVLRTLEIIGALRPRFWAMENPQTGLLKTRAFMQGLPYSDVCYCKYGFKYKKATRIWHNLPSAAVRRDRSRRQQSIKQHVLRVLQGALDKEWGQSSCSRPPSSKCSSPATQ